MFQLASNLASKLEDEGVPEVAALREEWANDTVHTYSFLFGMEESPCHGGDLKIYVLPCCKQQSSAFVLMIAVEISVESAA